MTIPDTIIQDIYSSTADLLDGFIPLLIILFGIGIAFYIIRNVANFIPK